MTEIMIFDSPTLKMRQYNRDMRLARHHAAGGSVEREASPALAKLLSEETRWLQEADALRQRITTGTSWEQRTAWKREFLGKTAEFVNGFLNSTLNYQSEVTAWYLVWLYDVDDIPRFLKMILKALEKGQKAPESFKSSLTTFLYDSIYSWSKREMENKRTPSPYFDEVYERLLREREEIPPELHYKMHNLWARLLMMLDPPAAREANEALDLAVKACPEKARVSTLRKKIQKALI